VTLLGRLEPEKKSRHNSYKTKKLAKENNMDKIYITTIDEEFEKARKPGAKDIKKRKKRMWTDFRGKVHSGKRPVRKYDY